MAMNNVYYRAKHLIGDEQYASLPARLRMQIIGKPGRRQGRLRAAGAWPSRRSPAAGSAWSRTRRPCAAPGFSREQVHEALRIAAVVHAAAVTLDAEAALA